MRLLVVDGMGGGIGKAIIAALKSRFPESEVVACGTNAWATQAMLKAGADLAVTGENAIVFQSRHCDAIIGSLGILIPNALQGELSPRMAEALAASEADKFLLPVHRCGIFIAAEEKETMAQTIDYLLGQIETALLGKEIED